MTEVQQPGSSPIPENLLAEHAEKQLRVEWSDGHESIYPCSYLRENCGCKDCRGEHHVGGEGSECIAAVTIVGGDVVAITFEDGHRSVFTFEQLLALCPCELHASRHT